MFSQCVFGNMKTSSIYELHELKLYMYGSSPHLRKITLTPINDYRSLFVSKSL